MSLLPWVPRVIMSGRRFRLPVQAKGDWPEVDFGPMKIIDRRYARRDGAYMYYLQAPSDSGDYILRATSQGRTDSVTVQVRTLDQLRRTSSYNGLSWPRRWPLERAWESTKRGQTLQDLPRRSRGNDQTLRWWLVQDDVTLWRQLPAAEWPRAHFVNVHQGCPSCGTAIFAHHGFYPWRRSLLPADGRSQCPSCEAIFPSNDLAAGDYSSGPFVDDGFGYFDEDGRLFLFAASYHRDLVGQYGGPIGQLTDLLRHAFDPEAARRLGLLLLRYAVETVYLAAVPQFRHGPSQEEEKAWDWGQPDWASAADPLAAFFRKGMLAYSIDVPVVSEGLALAYDTVWPFLKEDGELVARAQAQGLAIDSPTEAVRLIEEMLACQLQCLLDGGGLSNLPRVSEGALIILRSLDRADAQDALGWLYDKGPEKLRGFALNDFFPCGTPPEATGGYNDTHTRGLFSLEYHLQQLRQRHGMAYPEAQFPSLLHPARARRIARAPGEIALLGRIPFHFGDGGSAGVQESLEGRDRLAPLPPETQAQIENMMGPVSVDEALGDTALDGVGFAILRSAGAPERAAAGVVYGDAPYHRHMDLLDVQLYAFDRPFLSDLGYPQSWASVHYWEGHWASHNALWGVVPEVQPLDLPFDTPQPFLKALAGRGRLVRLAHFNGVHVAEVAAQRWAWNADQQRWYRPGVEFRRLIALVETEAEGIVLVDLARVQGGNEHWRVCRGLEGAFVPDGLAQVARPGTVAGADIGRGQLDQLAHPDHAGLAWMDEVAQLSVDGPWKGTWTSRRDDRAQLDLHLLRAPEETATMTARATAVMNQPQESRYAYRTVLWGGPVEAAATSCFDMVFEPHLGDPTLVGAESVAASDSQASGLRLHTRGGDEVALYWRPDAADEVCHFDDGTQLMGGLAVVRPAAAGHRRVGGSVQSGRIIALDRDGCTIDVEGLSGLAVGHRVRVRPSGRNYRIEDSTQLAGGGQRLRLDLSSILGRARMVGRKDNTCYLDFFLQARTGYLHDTHLEREADGWCGAIASAYNPDMDSTIVELLGEPGELAVGDWVRTVAYAVGDAVLGEVYK
ncbi:MAG: hypothetical protein GKR89_11540 [Candidatus Latescibacteria bacterium]|nr:hypothetical protein [Candidatus Latescibacterota bacterium]